MTNKFIFNVLNCLLKNSEIKKLQCFEDELVPEFYMEKCSRWYLEYKTEMSQAMDENNKKESASEVILKYKHVSVVNKNRLLMLLYIKELIGGMYQEFLKKARKALKSSTFKHWHCTTSSTIMPS